MISVNSVTVSFGGYDLFDNVSFLVNPKDRIGLAGKNGAGKSTLVNTLVGTKVTIVSHKVQTTRVPVRGIALEGKSQLVFIDTPGIFNPKRKLASPPRAEKERKQLSELASVGGTPTERPPGLPAISQRVLDDPAIDLPDSARWDIYRGEISGNLLKALAGAAKSNPIRVAVLKTGHPPTVWGTSNPSAHSEGLAADIWSVAGQPVVKQRQTGSAAFDTAGAFVSRGALQVGSPWTFTSDGFSTFTDDVHQDHIHVQQ